MVLAPLLMAALSASALSDVELAEQAQQAFAEGLALRADPVKARERFSTAAGLYEQLHERGHGNSALYRSQGNAALLGGNTALAILAYRRGLRHAPADPSLQEGLAAAREDVARKTSKLGRPPTDDRPPWLPRVGFATWSLLLCLVGYALGWLMLARWRMIQRNELLGGGVAVLLLSCGVAGVLGLATLYEQKENERTLVVIAGDDLPLRLGNGEAYGSRYKEKLPRGAEASLLHQRGNWVQIELSGREIGWVPRSAVLID